MKEREEGGARGEREGRREERMRREEGERKGRGRKKGFVIFDKLSIKLFDGKEIQPFWAISIFKFSEAWGLWSFILSPWTGSPGRLDQGPLSQEERPGLLSPSMVPSSALPVSAPASCASCTNTWPHVGFLEIAHLSQGTAECECQVTALGGSPYSLPIS